MASPLAGAWELVDDDTEGVIVLTDTHFCVLVVRKDRKPWPPDMRASEATDDMKADAWRALGPALAGTYEIVSSVGNTYETVMRPRLNRVPRPLRDIRETAALEGDLLTVTNPARGTTETWRRIG